MSAGDRARSIVRALALAATLIALVWIVFVVITGGFVLTIGGVRFSSREPMRPLWWGTLPLAIFVLANGVQRTARTWSSWTRRINHQTAITVIVLGVFAIGVAYATTVAFGSDAYGYVSEADLWLRGDLRLPQPWASEAPWPNAAQSFAPLGYRTAATGAPTDLVPIYSPGLPLLMATAKRLGGHAAAFLVVPLTGASLVLATWGIGRRLGSSAMGLIAALFVATSPAFLFMLVAPMSDVPAAACWAIALYCLLRPGARDATLAGLAAGLAILIRPNLVWLAIPPGVWLLWRTRDATTETRHVAVARLVGFSLGVAAGVAFIAALNARLYGSPLRSGYGDLGPLFGWSNVGANLRNYLGWLAASQTPLILLGLLAAVWPLRMLWPDVRDRSFLRVTSVSVLGLWVFYFLYVPFDAWWFLRFLLISWPFIMLGLASALSSIARRSSLGFVLCAWLGVILSVRGVNDARSRGAFALWRADREAVAAALATREAVPPTAVVLAEMHSGSVRYYGGRMTMEYVWLDGEWLDRAVAWLDDRRAPSYALLSRAEVATFKARFRGSAILARLDAPPVFLFADTGLALYALSTPFAGETQTLTYDPHALRAIPPVESLPFLLR